MHDHSHIPYGNLDIQTFTINSPTASGAWQNWHKPRGKTMMSILAIGCGGNGGNGAVGAASTAAGGGGGGSGGLCRVSAIPLHLIPDVLYVSVLNVANGQATTVSVRPSALANFCLAVANGGSNGGNASGGTAGAAGAAAPISAIANCALSTLGSAQFLAGQVGIIGGTTNNGGNLVIPTTGIMMTGGTGGGGLPSSPSTGSLGGSIVTPGFPFPSVVAMVAAPATDAPGPPGQHGIGEVSAYGLVMANGMPFSYGGQGGGSGGLSAAPAATAAGGDGGNGGRGSGGGGGGGGFTGAAASVGGRGGPGWCQIVCW